ncbi:carboxypeptidase-like regulatory domain-containing protein [Pedobacter metabolipauper]|uniref:carboxypeptidase-like regulatory domain-containing protein n=1 Tax=Pedobacter metabolipauper TaxID=425513 RepID=UPI001060AD03|nr:carboxypeptidase-like regulatory domain-containing protein [Pedobacter metabolipauper]
MNNDWLDIAVLEDYLDGKLDSKAMNRVEREALEDPFVAEALAGLSASPKRSLESISLLQKQLHDRIATQQTSKKTAVITWQRLSIAATAAVLFISVGIMFWMKQVNYQQAVANRPKKVDVVIAPLPLDSGVKEAAVIAAAKLPENNASSSADHTAVAVDQAIRAAKENSYAVNSKKNAVRANETRSAYVENSLADKETKVAAATEIKSNSLNEVVVVAFGTSARKESVGSVSVMRAAEQPVKNGIAGKVVEQYNGEPIPGVTVTLKGTNTSVQTNSQGEFLITIDTALKAPVLVASYIGFTKAEALAKKSGSQLLTIMMQEDGNSLNEVVVTSQSSDVAKALAGNVSGISVQGRVPAKEHDKFDDYLNKNNRYAKAPKIGRSVFLNFTLDKRGHPENIKVISGIDDKYNAEAIRLVQEGPKWKKLPKSAASSSISVKIDF